ncbi:hypothetical protein RHSIM_Rhsim13G0083800 [Rhododendron simsii]|uniref:Uncharacterized protein n=1 Tax=Rhododendron simsii TaxID=118357 RepID=A0A834L3C8_RHOSS|nr:hypothetical protein RHSIM_Rhsim13G0083800 [Rhododendron simsii]
MSIFNSSFPAFFRTSTVFETPVLRTNQQPVSNQMARRTEPNIRLKLLVDMKSRTVFFAEAGKDFVDFLFGLLELPLGSILGLARSTGKTGTGSWANVYESVKNMDEGYMQSSNTRKPLLEPKIPGYTETKPTALLKQLAYPYHLDCGSRPDGHVKGAATCMVMDDLTVKPVSTISSISLLNKRLELLKEDVTAVGSTFDLEA